MRRNRIKRHIVPLIDLIIDSLIIESGKHIVGIHDFRPVILLTVKRL